MFNEQSLKDRLKNKSKEIGVPFNNILIVYIFECLLKRVSKSNRKNSIILKGGVLVCSMYGLENRLTTDMDLSLYNENLSIESVTKILNDIININLNDGLTLTLIKIEPIKNMDIYGGLRANIAYKFDQMKGSISIDIATGDIITQNPTEYLYRTILDNDSFNILAYNIETIIAEKLETILERGIANSRMKDFYDLYIISKYSNKTKIDTEILISAIANTFNNRKYRYNKEIFGSIKNNRNLQQLWNYYSINNEFAYNITFEDVIKEIEHYLDYITN